jgi:outer membrane protein TolC
MNGGKILKILVICAVVLPAPALGEEAYPVLSRLIEQSLEKNPGVAASASLLSAAQARVPRAGSLPDPMLTVGAMSLPVDTFELDQEPMTQITVGVAQTFPYPGSLDTRTQASEYGLKTEEHLNLALRQETVYQVRAAYHELVFLDRAVEITSRNRELMRELSRIAEARYAAGMGIQQDALKAQVELLRMIDELISYEQGRVSVAAELNRLIYAEPGAPVPPARPATKRPEPPDRDELINNTRSRNPRLLASRISVEKAGAEEELARLSLLPELTVALGYGFREDGEMNGEKVERPDFLSAAVSVPVPLWKNRKQDQEVAEKEAQKTVARLTSDDVESRLVAGVEMLLADAKRLDSQIVLLETGIIPQARQSLESARAGYRTGKVDFLTLVDNQITLFKLEIRLARLNADYFKVIAALDRVSGKPVEEILKELN